MSIPAPLRVIGNLRLTANGVYADYLLSGQPFIFLSEEWQDRVATEHAELWRALPSGASISGLTVPVTPRSTVRKMWHSHRYVRTGAGIPDAVPPSARPCRAAAR